MTQNTPILIKLVLLAVCLGVISTILSIPQRAGAEPAIERVSAAASRDAVRHDGALLVCSYPDNRCQNILFQGAILLSEFEARLPSLSKDQTIIFYCS
jgi:hypothetical protein